MTGQVVTAWITWGVTFALGMVLADNINAWIDARRRR